MIDVFLIEDEDFILEELIFLLNQRQDVNILGSAPSVQESVEKLRYLSPELVLMDVQLKDGLSLEIFDQLATIDFGTIFITAFDFYALKAIKLSAFDYLLKPVDSDELNASIERFKETRNQFDFSKKQLELLLKSQSENFNEKLIIKTLQKTHLIDQQDILVCQGEGNYTTFYLKDGQKITSSKPLKHYKKILSEELFVQTHQSYLVNKKFIAEVDENNQIHLSEELFSVPVSVRRKKEIIQLIKR